MDEESTFSFPSKTSTDYHTVLHTRLAGWLQESKDSLSIAGPICNDANSLLSDARLRLEQASVWWAQTQYLYSAINDQVLTLQKVQDKATKRVVKNRKIFEVSTSQLNFFCVIFGFAGGKGDMMAVNFFCGGGVGLMVSLC